MQHRHDKRDLNKIAQQTVRIQNQDIRIEELEIQLASRDPLSDVLAMDGLRLAFENEELRDSITELRSDKESPKRKKSSAAVG
jgi:hypothetical protein